MYKIFYIVAAFLFSTTLAGLVTITPCGGSSALTASVDVSACNGATTPCQLTVGATVEITVTLNIPAPESYDSLYAFLTFTGFPISGPHNLCDYMTCPATGPNVYTTTTRVPSIPEGDYTVRVELRASSDLNSSLIYCAAMSFVIVR